MALHTGTPAADGGSVGLHSILTGSVPLVLLFEEASNAPDHGHTTPDILPYGGGVLGCGASGLRW